jgi:hypothetical protein
MHEDKFPMHQAANRRLLTSGLRHPVNLVQASHSAILASIAVFDVALSLDLESL